MNMDVETLDSPTWNGRWNHIQKVLERTSPFAHPDFEPNAEILDFMLNNCKILVIGAGGLGCELLKDLTLVGFRHIHVIDMDTIDLSNLNRQFLFRQSDVGKPKATVAANFVNKRVRGAEVIPHCCKIQDYDSSFYKLVNVAKYLLDTSDYRLHLKKAHGHGTSVHWFVAATFFLVVAEFHIIVCGLDNIVARRWINGMLISLLEYDDEGTLDQSSIIPLVDGGTEGFKGNVRVILPGMTACMECTLDLYPPQINYPMCTIAHTPRQPEHCVEYVKMFAWEKEKPFGELPIDGDDPDHIKWICRVASERAREFGIQGVTYRLTQGVVKHIIPAVASTNATIAAACSNEVFKLATSCSIPLNNYMVFNDVDGVYTYTFEAERNGACVACSQKPRTLHFTPTTQLREVIAHLCGDGALQMKSPGITTVVGGMNRTLYMKSIPSIEQATRSNLSKTLSGLGLESGQEIVVADVTTPNSLIFKVLFDTDGGKELAT